MHSGNETILFIGKVTLSKVELVAIPVTFRFGAKDARDKNAAKEKQYDLLLDDEIEFIQVHSDL